MSDPEYLKHESDDINIDKLNWSIGRLRKQLKDIDRELYENGMEQILIAEKYQEQKKKCKRISDEFNFYFDRLERKLERRKMYRGESSRQK